MQSGISTYIGGACSSGTQERGQGEAQEATLGVFISRKELGKDFSKSDAANPFLQ